MINKLNHGYSTGDGGIASQRGMCYSSGNTETKENTMSLALYYMTQKFGVMIADSRNILPDNNIRDNFQKMLVSKKHHALFSITNSASYIDYNNMTEISFLHELNRYLDDNDNLKTALYDYARVIQQYLPGNTDSEVFSIFYADHTIQYVKVSVSVNGISFHYGTPPENGILLSSGIYSLNYSNTKLATYKNDTDIIRALSDTMKKYIDIEENLSPVSRIQSPLHIATIDAVGISNIMEQY